MLDKKSGSVILYIATLPKRWLVNLIVVQEKKQYSFYVVLLFAFFVALMRFTLEFMLSYKHLYLLNATLLATLTFYLQCIFIYTLILKLFIPGFEWKKSIHLVLIGVFLGVFPPIIDSFVYGLGNFDYAYVENFSDWNWLIYNMGANVPLGEAIVLFITMLLVATVVYIKTDKFILAFLALLFSYGAVFFYGGVVPWVADDISSFAQPVLHNSIMPYLTETPAAQQSVQIPLLPYLHIAICISIYFILNPVLLKRIFLRLNHGVPVVLTCLLGYSVYKEIDGYGVLIAVMVLFASMVVIIQNDYFDSDQDKLDGREPYVSKDDLAFFNSMLFLITALLIASANFAGYMLLLFMVASILYNYDFYRGKSYFPTSYKLEGLAGLAAYLTGVAMVIATSYQIGGDQLNVKDLSSRGGGGMFWPMEQVLAEVWSLQHVLIAFFVFGGWSIISVIKDYKDIESDSRGGNQTIYTLLLKNNRNITIFHRRYIFCVSVLMLIPLLWLNRIGAPIISALLLFVLCVLFFILSVRPASNGTVGFSLLVINLYLANLVLWFHLSHS